MYPYPHSCIKQCLCVLSILHVCHFERVRHISPRSFHRMQLPPFRLTFFWPRLSFVPFGIDGAARCCATLHKGTPKGSEEERHGLNTYTVEPTRTGILQPKGVVVIIPDIFGWTLPNIRMLADEMAKKGPFVVLLPDLMDGTYHRGSGVWTT